MSLRLVAMVVGGVASLFYTRLLLHSMGSTMYGSFLTFSALIRFGGLGDLGISSGLANRASIMLGEGKNCAVVDMLGPVRGLFLVVALGIFVVLTFLAPFAPHWFGFTNHDLLGSPFLLFVVGACSVSLLVLAGYFHALNYACGTITWGIVPTLMIGPLLAPFIHLLLALAGFPLWIQMIPYACSTLLSGVLAWWMLRFARPQLAKVRPITIDRDERVEFLGFVWYIYFLAYRSYSHQQLFWLVFCSRLCFKLQGMRASN
jgi:hypothetical protein